MSFHNDDGQGELKALTRERYVTIFTKIALALLEEDEREEDKAMEECKALALEAWESDAKGADTLPKHKWLDSLFELADTWTIGIGAHEYADFLGLLFNRTAEREERTRAVVFRRDDAVVPMPPQAVEEEEEEEEEEEPQPEPEPAARKGGGGGKGDKGGKADKGDAKTGGAKAGGAKDSKATKEATVADARSGSGSGGKTSGGGKNGSIGGGGKGGASGSGGAAAAKREADEAAKKANKEAERKRAKEERERAQAQRKEGREQRKGERPAAPPPCEAHVHGYYAAALATPPCNAVADLG